MSFFISEKPIEIVSGLKDKVCVEFKDTKFDIKLNKPGKSNKLKWFKNGAEIDTNSDKYELREQGEMYTLVVKNVNFEDEGEYSVKIENSDAESKAVLVVEGIYTQIAYASANRRNYV